MARHDKRHIALGLAGVLALGLAWWSWPRDDAASTEPAQVAARGSDGSTRTQDGTPEREGSGREASGGRAPGGPVRAGELPVGGSVIDPESGPLAEGRLDLVCTDHRVLARLPLREDGRFAGEACPESITCARLVHPTFEQPIAWELEPGHTRELEAVRARGIVGRVVSGGEVVANASVMLRRAGARASGSTDTDGEFALSLPALRPCDACDPQDDRRVCRPVDRVEPDAPAKLLVWADNHAPREVEVMLTSEPIEIELFAPAAPISGRVLGSDGQPLGARTVVLATNIERAAEQHAADVQADGAFVLDDLADAGYRLRVVRDGVELASLDRVTAGQEIELRATVAARFVTAEIEVVDAQGQVAPGVRVDGGPLRGAVTDADGLVRAEDVLPGRYPLRVRAPACPVVRADLQIDPDRGATHQQTVHLMDCSLDAP